ncbi:hypothetical protein ASPWEDRAFT_34071 [Aspergillus wentii DTO 134E9]|uniref:Uncharacterized protein n=1 Tax=Aspergillus wentii DTO 134E9 TaxID=1073089 RepID=A0A1L9S0J2_ASPWE|nr:uncharacterized protein ASPWEDRAFT_34071 [Aspergillus wentii DTO 134E9]KAI9931346.1 N-terminal acetyltransferase [Aspergillus wentii]OJJ40638.1 hypothetical protein ASPWEDRAFT_34071 [Aspergillus wentii DTO 134E9]
MTPTYTPEQLEQYLLRIQYSSDSTIHSRLQHLQQCVQKDPLASIAELQRRHLSTIPWGNSGLHYSPHHSISTHPEHVFEKLVVRRLDGYCMETTNLLLGVLRSLGYQVYSTGGRVSHAAAMGVANGLYLALGHMLLIVTIEGRKYMVDVGFGSNCATRPLPLEENAVATFIAPGEMRLIKDSIPELTDKSQRLWIYQVRYTPESEWIPQICFSEVEFLPQDFAVLNFFTSQNPVSWFTQSFVCARMILDGSGNDIQGQYIMWGNDVKMRVRGQSEVLQTLKTEEDRIQALARWFDMRFREDEILAIRGTISEIV